MADILVNGTLKNNTPNGVIAYAEQIGVGSKKQSQINNEFSGRITALEKNGGGGSVDLTEVEERLTTLENSAGITMIPSNYVVGGYFGSNGELVNDPNYGYTSQYIYYGIGNGGVSYTFRMYYGNAYNDIYKKAYMVPYKSDFSKESAWMVVLGAPDVDYREVTLRNSYTAVWMRFSFPLKYKDSFRVTTVVNGVQTEVWKPIDHAPTEGERVHEYANNVITMLRNKQFKCLFFSDVHGSDENVRHVAQLANGLGGNYVDAILNAGDTVELVYAQEAIKRGATKQESATAYNTDYDDYGMTWYDEIMDNCSIDSLIAIGNHDVKGDCTSGGKVPSAETDAIMGSEEQNYNRFIKPTVDRFAERISLSYSLGDEKYKHGTMVHSNNECYYYVDYDKIRVIVLCSMSGVNTVEEFDSRAGTAQLTFLTNTLADAKTNNKAVIILNHTAKTITKVSKFNSDGNSSNWMPSDEVVAAVDSFISGGGEFVCWLVGHRHMDVFGYFGTQHQTAFITASARFDYSKNNPIPTQKFFDLFNFIAVDTTAKYLYVYRIGANYNDARGGVRDYLIYNYSTNKVVNDGSDIANISGSTSQRPKSSDGIYIYAGFMYFDTTLNKMIVWNGSAWTNLDGTALS